MAKILLVNDNATKRIIVDDGETIQTITEYEADRSFPEDEEKGKEFLREILDFPQWGDWDRIRREEFERYLDMKEVEIVAEIEE